MASALLAWTSSLPLVSAVSRPLRRVAYQLRGRARAPWCPSIPLAVPNVALQLVPAPPIVPVAAAQRPAGPPLRVIMRPQADGACRLVISGRMADVCAELDRLALAC
ncbi:hypothetical protein [Pulveribacter suum]|uniref:Uncharacterized protein n=1 Tax=Pulveribacter suum TaxID=2116657 RepID=A0A2P1NLX9_9BURK|nr:hypothetical protein [Pulveribacter suum]AVP58069.1 hypothetical protein C7H73_10610 [Pulveribacter suum]